MSSKTFEAISDALIILGMGLFWVHGGNNLACCNSRELAVVTRARADLLRLVAGRSTFKFLENISASSVQFHTLYTIVW